MTSKISANLSRFGKNVDPQWYEGTEATAPLANATLVTRTVSANKIGLIYGFMINVTEANDFLISWTSGGVAKSKRITFGSQGCMITELATALNKHLTADASTAITIKNVNAGSALKTYKADILIAEASA